MPRERVNVARVSAPMTRVRPFAALGRGATMPKGLEFLEDIRVRVLVRKGPGGEGPDARWTSHVAARPMPTRVGSITAHGGGEVARVPGRAFGGIFAAAAKTLQRIDDRARLGVDGVHTQNQQRDRRLHPVHPSALWWIARTYGE